MREPSLVRSVQRKSRSDVTPTHAGQLPGDVDERRDFVKFTQLYKTGQNGKGDHQLFEDIFLRESH